MTEPKEITAKSLTVMASTLIATSLNGVTFASIAIAVFMVEITADYKWGRADIGGAVMLLRIGMAVGAPLFGHLVDRHGPRAVLLPLTLASGLILGSFSILGQSLFLFCLAHLLLGMSQPGAVAYSKLLATWFFRRRGMALATLGFGTLAAKFAVPPIAAYLKEAVGWHGAYLVLGLTELLIAFPILYAFFRERRPDGQASTAPAGEEIHPDGAPRISIRQAVTGRTFWLLVGAEAAAFFAFIGISTHAIGILTEHGLASSTAVWGLSIFAAGGLISQLMAGYLLDRFHTPRVILPFAIGSLVSLLLLQASDGEAMTLACLLLFGIACGGQTSTTSYFTTRYFGVRNFSTIYGWLFPIFLLFSAPAPLIMGAIYDSQQSYELALIVVDIAMAASILFIWLLKPYPYPVGTTTTDSR